MPSSRDMTVDAAAGLVRRWLLDPKLAVPLALGLHWRPIVALLGSRLAPHQATELRWWTVLVAAASVVVAANDYLTKQAANNWVRGSPWSWDDEIVVVTGGSSGLGASISRALLARNRRAPVVVDFQPLRWTPPPDARVHLYRCDLSDPSALAATCSSIKRDVGHPSVLFNNAGLARGSNLLEGQAADVNITMRTNLTAPFLLAREFLPEMARRDHGHVVNTGSLVAILPAPTMVDYAATKAGLAALHEVHRRATSPGDPRRLTTGARDCSWSSRPKGRAGCG